MLKGLLSELTSGYMGLEIPPYARNDNSDASYHVDSAHTVTNEKRLNGLLGSNGLLESNIEEAEQNNWLVVGYIPGGINTSDGLSKSLSSVDTANLLACDISRISAEQKKKGISRKTPSGKRYTVFLKLLRGRIWKVTCGARLA